MLKKILNLLFPSAISKYHISQKLQPQFHSMEIKVAGVTFKNGRKSRQAILRKIKYKDKPFDKALNITFQGYEFEGAPAIGIYVNEQQIGNVPRTQVKEFISHKNNPFIIDSLNVYGGNDGKSFGCIINIRFQTS